MVVNKNLFTTSKKCISLPLLSKRNIFMYLFSLPKQPILADHWSVNLRWCCGQADF